MSLIKESKWLNPWHLPLKTDFSISYGKVCYLTKKAEKIENSSLQTIVKIVSFPIEMLATLFCTPAAFVLNNLFGRIYNAVIHVQNRRMQKNAGWKIQNYKPFLVGSVIGSTAMVVLHRLEIISLNSPIQKIHSLFMLQKDPVDPPPEDQLPNFTLLEKIRVVFVKGIVPVASRAYSILAAAITFSKDSISSYCYQRIAQFGWWMCK